MDFFIGLGIFAAAVLLIEGGYYAYMGIRNPGKQLARKRLRAYSSTRATNEEPDITRKTLLSEIPWLNRLLLKLQWTEKVNRFLEQANVGFPIGVFLLLSLALGAVGFIAGFRIFGNFLMAILIGVLLGAIPYLYVSRKRAHRMKKFQRQLPEVLDLIARALKAGHAFSGGLKMVSEEFDDPAGPEFGKTLDEINFGVHTNDALKNLSQRVDCPDLKFFVISVIIQRETGGNLAEILENIARLIRERFKLLGNIRTLSAEGRLSAAVLVAIPFVAATALSLLNPGYVNILFTDPIGKVMVGVALGMMVLGILTIRRLIEIKV